MSSQKKSFNAQHYVLCVVSEHGHRRVFSPDFGFHFAVPQSEDPHRWTALTLQQAETEIEKRLQRLKREDKEQPEPMKWKEVFQAKPKDLVGIKEAAHLLQVSEQTVRRMTDRGMLKSYKSPGGHRKYSFSEIKNYCEETF